MTLRCVLRGCGGYLPSRIVTNDDLARIIDTSDEWISSRTGIKARHIASSSETTAFMGAQAAQSALERAGLRAQDIDMIIVATTTPDQAFPATAVRIQALLGMTSGAAFDVSAACSGFVYGMHLVDAMIASKKAKNILLIGSEVYSRIVDWQDRRTCVLFGDGAGAMVFSAAEDDTHKHGLLKTEIHSDGRLGDILYVDGAVGVHKESQFLKMKGREVFRHAVSALSHSAETMLRSFGLEGHDLDWLIPHQANIRIINAVGKKLGLTLDKIVVTVEGHANTSAASIPLAFNQAVADGKLAPGQLVLVEALGGGLTWGTALLRL